MVNFFIERPIFAASVAIIMVLAGLICYPLLPVAQFPEVTPPLVVVSATYPGASAQVVADTVTTPLEQQINGVPGMIYMSSTSANDGSSNITVSFDVGYPIDIAAVDVQNRVSAATAQLPAIVNQGGVTVQKKNTNLTLAVNLYSPDGSVDLVTLSNYAYLQLVDPLKRITGPGSIRTSSRSSASPPSTCRTRSPSRTSRWLRGRSAAPRRRPVPCSRRRSMPWAGSAIPNNSTTS